MKNATDVLSASSGATAYSKTVSSSRPLDRPLRKRAIEVLEAAGGNWTLNRCTLTGADDTTNIDSLWEISREFPMVEWGILYSINNRGTGRYPGEDWLNRLLARIDAGGPTPNFALHVCGRAVADFFAGAGPVTDVARRFGRVQVNFRYDQLDFYAIRAMLRRQAEAGQTVITQHNRANQELWAAMRGEPNHVVLFDSSGGRGIVRPEWPAPLPGVSCGYAGGLGPDNINEALVAIQRAAGAAEYWIDMEGKLRTADDRFDVALARTVLEQVQTTLNIHS